MAQELRFEEVRDEGRFDPLRVTPGAPFTQAWFYGAWQETLGRRVRRFAALRGGDLALAFQAIGYPLPFGRRYLYLPYGPCVRGELSAADIFALRSVLLQVAREERAVFCRLDFTPPLIGAAEAAARRAFRLASPAASRGAHFQPRTEWILDLAQAEESLLKGMHHNTRYGIRFAERHGVEIELVEAAGLPARFDDFYRVLEETSSRNRFGLHPRAYYEAVFADAAERRNAFLVFGTYAGELLVAHLILLYGGTAHFIFGGSKSSRRDLQPSYLAQWTAIREAKRRGMARYNFGGVSTARDAHAEWEGLSNFKRKFGGVPLEHGGLYDLAADPFWYYAYVARKLFA